MRNESITDCITKLKYHLHRPVLKHNLFTRHLNYYKKIFYIFFSPSIRMSRKSINFEDKKNQQKQFLQKEKTI